MIERWRIAPDRQIRARHIAPTVVIMEGDVDAVIVGAERDLQERG